MGLSPDAYFPPLPLKVTGMLIRFIKENNLASDRDVVELELEPEKTRVDPGSLESSSFTLGGT
jgi:hypothetical protein